jgi:transcriptional regulator with XRE-family HTH domain
MELSDIIGHIRSAAGLSQERFADKVGVTRLTVTRWENGASIPNRIAQIKIYDISKEYGVQFFDLIMSDLPEYKIKNDRIVLYHASRSGINGPIMPISRSVCDFGKGFYMGTQASQPLTMIFSSDNSRTERAVMYTLELDLRGLKILYIPPGIDWALLIAYSRTKMEEYAGSALYKKYSKMLDGHDVAVGKIADDKIFTSLDLFFDKTITDKVVVECLSALPLGEQYVALTEKACRQIRILEQRRFSELERLCIYDVSEHNRRRGREMANKICRDHRRDGIFFDEIMEKGR